MAIYEVTAIAMNRWTRAQRGAQRTEAVNTATNPIFKKCQTPYAVEQAYESFWNDLNPDSSEVVKVISLRRTK